MVAKVNGKNDTTKKKLTFLTTKQQNETNNKTIATFHPYEL
jgi:hypothetical protein